MAKKDLVISLDKQLTTLANPVVWKMLIEICSHQPAQMRRCAILLQPHPLPG
jgi:hypothetical protein